MRFLSLYIHVPYCRNLCGYCHFYRVLPPEGAEGKYLAALLAEAESLREEAAARPVRTVYVGGGTPSLFSPDFYAELFRRLGRILPLEEAGERSIEVNPEAGSEAVAELAATFNRVSLGVQSFDPRSLALLGRRGDPRQAVEAFAAARKAGYASVGVDLIYAFAGQDEDSFAGDLTAALALGADHVSLYALEGREEGPGGDAGPGEAEPEVMAAMYREARRILLAGGLRQYEISNFARPGHECLHNLNYWADGDYLGLGPSAAGSLTREGVRVRWRVREDAEGYHADPAGCRVALSREEGRERAAEALVIGLRRTKGVERADFARRYGVDPGREWGRVLREFAAAGLVKVSPSRLRLTTRGMLLSNELFARLL